MKTYVTPNLEIVTVESDDILTLSVGSTSAKDEDISNSDYFEIRW